MHVNQAKRALGRKRKNEKHRTYGQQKEVIKLGQNGCHSKQESRPEPCLPGNRLLNFPSVCTQPATGNLSGGGPGNLRGICRGHKKFLINFYLNPALANRNPKWIVATRMGAIESRGDNFYNSPTRWKFNFIFNLMLQRATKNEPALQRITLNLLLSVELFCCHLNWLTCNEMIEK